MVMLYEIGQKPTRFQIKEGEEAYNVKDKIKYTKDKWDNIITIGSVLNNMFQYDSVTRNFTTAWAEGKTWDVFTKNIGTDVVLSWRCPFRNESTSWGGGYIDIQLSINGGAYASLGNSGYDGGVMDMGSATIASMAGTFLLDLDTVRAASTIQIKFLHRSYDGSVIINGSHSIVTGSLGAFWSNVTLMEVPNKQKG